MKYAETRVLALCLCAGGIGAVAQGAQPPTVLEPSAANVREAAHLYINLSTGERVITLLHDGQTSGADTGESELLWATATGSHCAGAGYTSEFYFAVDDNSGTTSLSTGVRVLDYADIAKDTVVDCVRVQWVVEHDDVDMNSDGIGDGVGGLGGTWAFWDGENGRELNISTRTGLIAFTFVDLPGNIFGDGQAASYTADVDLSAAFTGTSLSFEICDTDSDLQGAAVHNAGIGNLDQDVDGQPDSDLDGDGLSDWGWSVRFHQPGTFDYDGDGSLDGDINDGFMAIGIRLGHPGDDPMAPAYATGLEDRYVVFDQNDDYVGGFNFGGYNCDPGQDTYTPFGAFEMFVWGPGDGPVCRADFNDDGLLNFFDVSLFLSDFNAGGDYNGDGGTNFFDVSSFLSDFGEGCP